MFLETNKINLVYSENRLLPGLQRGHRIRVNASKLFKESCTEQAMKEGTLRATALRQKPLWDQSNTLTRVHTHSDTDNLVWLLFGSIRKSFFSSWGGAAINVNHRQSEGIHLNDSDSWKQVDCCQGSTPGIKSPGSIKESITAVRSPDSTVLIPEDIALDNQNRLSCKNYKDRALHTLFFLLFAVMPHMFCALHTEKN